MQNNPQKQQQQKKEGGDLRELPCCFDIMIGRQMRVGGGTEKS